jgi:hypothetical protein
MNGGAFHRVAGIRLIVSNPVSCSTFIVFINLARGNRH